MALARQTPTPPTTATISMPSSIISVFTSILALSVAGAFSAPMSDLQPRAGEFLRANDRGNVEGKTTCEKTGPVIDVHDCNRALLKMGNGIAGKIQGLNFNADTTVGVFGTCQLKATANKGGKAPIGISKGRLEAIYRVILNDCVAGKGVGRGVNPGSANSFVGSKGGGLVIEISQVGAGAAAKPAAAKPAAAKPAAVKPAAKPAAEPEPEAAADEPIKLEFGPNGVKDPRNKPTDIGVINVAPVCTEPDVALVSGDCNRAMLKLGNGIAKPIEVLKFDGTTTDGVFGGCRMRVSVAPGGEGPIGLTKGRLQAAFRVFKAKCGVRPGKIGVKLGATKGNTTIEVFENKE
ncbi:hypothetical protein HDU97_009537 [Phlyctochytrium planicorne]|nr:hypothetical protein HDU97_009537 [Phlyctochytrium planicorne]